MSEVGAESLEAATNAKANVIFVKFGIGSNVLIRAIDVRGIVKAINVAAASVEYQIAYFDDDKVRRVEWMEAMELEA